MNTDGCLAYLRRVGLLMNADTLFEPVQLGSLLLANRVFMAPLTRRFHDRSWETRLVAKAQVSLAIGSGLV
ncbi:2,4-dienoyl-CoA reductase-like NADH-dependent reductase (Old Yellow Enzyme family) [Granulicella arctica]|uniref:2,4-dienoyl-CoA reductase-like NADH-dependent reductase (Old Yellow Enzyme family) n=1 Tax=Granulicella arctica TaxID=940613 RepID=A0A7Y9PDN7_9BACT|nr:2,4-dienoyl-CoA reductase-like NADH-dependent reductase (Old Yellow Enzyme family) [Granulicella arctica]